MIRFIIHAMAAALGFWIAARLVGGFRVLDMISLLESALMLGFINALARPLIVFLIYPLTVIRLGLFLLLMNGLTLWCLTRFSRGIFIDDLGPGVRAAAVITLVSWTVNVLVGGMREKPARDRIRI
jgi:putative membrane protein